MTLPFLLGITSLRDALQLCVNGELRPEDLTAWASDVELNEQIEYDAKHNKAIATVLFQISSPEVNGTIDRERCLELITILDELAKLP